MWCGMYSTIMNFRLHDTLTRKESLITNMIAHFPLTPADIDTANNIFSCNILSLNEKTSIRHPPPVLSDYIEIPIKIKYMSQRLKISEDIMFVIRLSFLVSLLLSIKFMMVEYIPHHIDNVRS